MSSNVTLIDQSAEAGKRRAEALINAAAAKPEAVVKGYVIAEGDSWFDYPFYQDIVEALEDNHGYRVRSAAHHGDTAEGMAYQDNQLNKVRKVFEELAEDAKKDTKKEPRAILLSCGGNDVAHAFDLVLNHKASMLPTVNKSIVTGLLDERIQAAVSSLIGSMKQFSHQYFGKDITILIHGYGHPVPDGRGFPILSLSGPWLKPGFAAKGYVSADPQSDAELTANAAVVGGLIDHYNAILQQIAAVFSGTVKYIDLRAVFSSTVPGQVYQQDWRDEMHATKKAFAAAAALIAAQIP